MTSPNNNSVPSEQAVVPVGNAGSLLSVIERAARDPLVDVDKLERLFALQERVLERTAKQAFTEAKIVMRPELPEVTMKGHIVIRDKEGRVTQDTPFARFEDIHEAIMPILSAHGFDLKFRNGTSDGKVLVTTILSHRDGHEESTDFILPYDSSGSKNSVQAVGSSTSYGKRYGTLTILNIKVAGEDDDGNAASYKDTTGAPLARTKLEGPHESKTALKGAIHAIRSKVATCTDRASLDAILKAEKPTIDQAAKDWDALLTGFPDIPEDKGLRGDVEVKRAAIQGEGMFAGLLATMRANETVKALNEWRDANETVIESLDGGEAREFDRAWDQRESEILMMDRSAA